MSDIFVSYKSSDRPRAETLKSWFESAGWTVWIDRGIGIGEEWEKIIKKELDSARLVVVLWSAEARRSEWIMREAGFALRTGRLLQIHATGLPLLKPFDKLQAVRMQAWTGEEFHSERLRLLMAVAERLGSTLPGEVRRTGPNEDIRAYDPDVSEALGLAFYYCARQLERVRLQNKRGYSVEEDFSEIRSSFSAMLSLVKQSAEASDDREGVLHMLANDFFQELELLSPDPNAVE